MLRFASALVQNRIGLRDGEITRKCCLALNLSAAELLPRFGNDGRIRVFGLCWQEGASLGHSQPSCLGSMVIVLSGLSPTC